MNQHKTTHTILVSSVVAVFIISVSKYLLYSELLPPMAISLEIISWLLLIAMVYWLLSKYFRQENLINQLNQTIEEQSAIHNNQVATFQQRINHLEELEKEKALFNSDKHKSLAKIKATFKTNNQKDFHHSILPAIGKVVETVTAIFYWLDKSSNSFIVTSTFAIDNNYQIASFKAGEGFCGQAVSDRQILHLDEIPDDYYSVSSGLGAHRPNHIYFIPILINNQVMGLIEIGTFKKTEIELIWPDINAEIEAIASSF
jgi:hypothetical protein